MFGKLFKKHPREKDFVRFWKDFESRSGLYLDILAKDDEDSDDYMWMTAALHKSLRLCCLDATVPFDLEINSARDPIMFIFHHSNDEYLLEAADLLKKHYPASLSGVIDFETRE